MNRKAHEHDRRIARRLLGAAAAARRPKQMRRHRGDTSRSDYDRGPEFAVTQPHEHITTRLGSDPTTSSSGGRAAATIGTLGTGNRRVRRHRRWVLVYYQASPTTRRFDSNLVDGDDDE